MVSNVIFDMGNVLIPFEPERMMANAGVPAEDRGLFQHTVFFSKEWIMFDRGTIEEAEAKRRMAEKLPPRLHTAVEHAFDNIFLGSEPFADVYELILDCKRQGLGVYLLSNASMRFYDYRKRIPAIELMDGMVVSCDVQLLKPDPAIFRLLFEKFSLAPETCFFVDDMPLNIEAAAEHCNMRGFVFRNNTQALRQELMIAGVKL